MRQNWTMSLDSRLLPDHRQTFSSPQPWASSVQACLREGAFWLHGTGWEGDLLALPGGPRLEALWEAGGWITRLNGREEAGTPFEALERASNAAHPWVGAVSFELACDEAGLRRKPLPEGSKGMLWQGVTQAIHYSDGKAEVWGWGEPLPPRLEVADALAGATLKPQLGRLHPGWDESCHRAAVEAIRASILDGGFYVANLCVPFEAHWSGDASTLALSAIQRATPPFSAYLPLGGLTLLCLSMERVLSKRGGSLVSEPIKGSAPCTGDAGTDAALGAAMLADPKEGAEHVMIVDLVRNDLGRVSEPGSVRVTDLMALRAYPTVQHLVSRVESKARSSAGLAQIFRSVLPGGSVTGAPKAAVCAHLAEAEAGPRGFYCGALGWLKGGDMELALPIRTAQIFEDHLTYWAGGGITLRSDASKEWQELHLKTKVIEASGREGPRPRRLP